MVCKYQSRNLHKTMFSSLTYGEISTANHAKNCLVYFDRCAESYVIVRVILNLVDLESISGQCLSQNLNILPQ